MKKVLFVINTLGCAGAEKALLQLLKLFKPDQYEVSLYVLLDQGELIHELPNYVKVLNTDYRNISVLDQKGKKILLHHIIKRLFVNKSIFKNFVYILKNSMTMIFEKNMHIDKLLWRILSDSGMHNENEYDLAVAYLEGGSTYYVHDHINAKKKATFLHVDYSKAGYSRKLDGDCYLDFNRIFCVSDEVKDSLLHIYPEVADYTYIFHNILDVHEIRNKSNEGVGFMDSYPGKRILTVGRLTSQKAYEIAIKAMYLLKKKGIQARWYVLGEGNLRKKLEKEIQIHGLQDDFLLLGVKPNPYPFYRECDLYVHATRFEGKSIAIQEAQILGKPILVSDCSGNREQVNDGVDGYLVELDAVAISEKIAYLLEHPAILNHIANQAKIKYQRDTIHLDEIFDF